MIRQCPNPSDSGSQSRLALNLRREGTMQTIAEMMEQFARSGGEPIVFSESTGKPVAVLITPEQALKLDGGRVPSVKPTRGERKERAIRREKQEKQAARERKARNIARNADQRRRKTYARSPMLRRFS